LRDIYILSAVPKASDRSGVGNMRKLSSILVVSMLIFGSFVILSPGAKAQGSAPTWSIGDYWEYSGSVDISGTMYSVIVRLQVESKFTLSIDTSEYESFNCTVSLAVSSGGTSFTLTSYIYLRTSDLAMVKTYQSFMGFTSVDTYNPPQETFQFPLSDGQTWSSTSTHNSTSGGHTYTTTITNDFSVSGSTSVTVPAGTFNTFTVTETPRGGGSPGKIYYSDSIGYAAKLNGSVMGLSLTLGMDLVLKSFKYQNAPAGSLLIILIVVIVIVVVVVAILIAVMMSRQRRRGVYVQPPNSAYGQPPQGPYQPPQGPYQPPQGPYRPPSQP
jgi:hypothetical protein